MPKIFRILSKDRVPERHFVNFLPYISTLNFWLVICIAKNFIWTNLNAIFSLFRFLCTIKFHIFKYFIILQIQSYPNKPYINGKLIYSPFNVWIPTSKKCTLITVFVVHARSHISCYFYGIFYCLKSVNNGSNAPHIFCHFHMNYVSFLPILRSIWDSAHNSSIYQSGGQNLSSKQDKVIQRSQFNLRLYTGA